MAHMVMKIDFHAPLFVTFVCKSKTATYQRRFLHLQCSKQAHNSQIASIAKQIITSNHHESHSSCPLRSSVGLQRCFCRYWPRCCCRHLGISNHHSQWSPYERGSHRHDPSCPLVVSQPDLQPRAALYSSVEQRQGRERLAPQPSISW